MAEYINREAAKREFNLHFGGVSHAVIASKILDEIPAADVVEVVRCKDCKYFRDYTDRHGVVRMNCIRDWHIPQVEPEHFCSYGERRNNDETD